MESEYSRRRWFTGIFNHNHFSGFAYDDLKKRKYPANDSCVVKNALFMLIERHFKKSVTATKVSRKCFINAQHVAPLGRWATAAVDPFGSLKNLKMEGTIHTGSPQLENNRWGKHCLV